MRCPLALACLGLLALSAPAFAGTTPPGVNLRWDHCFADGGTANRTFACDTNSGLETMVMSFELDHAESGASGVEVTIDMNSAAAAMPAWWTFKNPGTCRPSSVLASLTPPAGTLQCVEWSGGNASGGLAAYSINGLFASNQATLLAAFAVLPENLVNLSAGVEYFVGAITINHAKTVGTGACAGCQVPVCLFLTRLVVTFPPVAGQPSRDIPLGRGANGPASQYATWQDGAPINIVRGCSSANPFVCYPLVSYNCVLATTTSSRGSTWGAVKSLYR